MYMWTNIYEEMFFDLIPIDILFKIDQLYNLTIKDKIVDGINIFFHK